MRNHNLNWKWWQERNVNLRHQYPWAKRGWVSSLKQDKRKYATRSCYCPERQIDRFFIKNKYDTTPDLWCNTQRGQRIGRWL